MFVRHFDPDHFFRSVYGTEPFRGYCQHRAILFDQTPDALVQLRDVDRWAAALSSLPDAERAAVELDLRKVNEMSDRVATDHLLAACAGKLPTDRIPSGTALALWCFLHHQDVFHDVFLAHELQDVDSWRNARGPSGVDLHPLPEKSAALAKSLRDFFRRGEGTGRFCTADARVLDGVVCFVALISDRPELLDVFRETGEHATERLRPATQVLFTYAPGDGTISVQSRLRSQTRILDLFQRFARVVLGVVLDPACLAPAYDLDRLKRPFHPLPDAPDMEMVRVKTLHLRYPQHAGIGLVKLETPVEAEPSAMANLLDEHAGAPGLLDRLHVCYAELQVRLRAGVLRKNHVIRLWPNRSSLPQTPLGERFRSCLRRWGLCHVRQS